MHLNRQTDYSLRLMIYLAVNDEGLATIAEVAENFAISRNHLMKIVNNLSRLGYLQTLRGKGGGIRLAKEPDEIRLGEVVQAVEPQSPLVDCSKPPCPIARSCSLIGIMGEASDAFYDTLNRYCLSDVIMEPEQLRALLQNRDRPSPAGEGKRTAH